MLRQEIRVDGLSEPISHYTDLVRFGDLAYLSGTAPLDATGRLVGDDALEQTRQVLRNIQLMLDSLGAGFADILKVTVYLTDIDDRELVNVARKEFFGDARPASTLVEVAQLAIPGMKVEIEAVVGTPPTTS